jgi:hypothetical protein
MRDHVSETWSDYSLIEICLLFEKKKHKANISSGSANQKSTDYVYIPIQSTYTVNMKEASCVKNLMGERSRYQVLRSHGEKIHWVPGNSGKAAELRASEVEKYPAGLTNRLD